MKGICYLIMLLITFCANEMCFVGYKRMRTCRLHISRPPADGVRRALSQGPISGMKCAPEQGVVSAVDIAMGRSPDKRVALLFLGR